MRNLLVSINNENKTYNSSCKQQDQTELTDCIETSDRFNIQRVGQCANSLLKFVLDYNLDNRLYNCVLKKLPPFTYNFNINCKFLNLKTQSGTNSNFSIVGITKITLSSDAVNNNVFPNEPVEYKCNVECANPNDFYYKWSVNTTSTNEYNETAQFTNSTDRFTDTFKLESIFNTTIVTCCVTNGIGEIKCKSIETFYMGKIFSYFSSGPFSEASVFFYIHTF